MSSPARVNSLGNEGGAARLAERQIVERVRHMLPAYRIVHARVVAAQKRKEG